MLIIIKVMVKHGQVPNHITGPYDVGQGLPFGISVWVHGNIRESIDNINRKNMSVKHGDAL
jgi:hypothetical protein